MIANQGLTRRVDVEETVGPAVFLAGDAWSCVTGQTLVVDGGEAAA